MTIKFTVYGIPIPQGSTRAFVPKGWKRPIITAANSKTKPWRQEISGACIASLNGTECAGRSVPIRLEARFFFPRPKSVKANDKTTKPDIDKLVRALCDALTGVVFEDDSQVTEIHAVKLFGNPPRLEVQVSEVDCPPGTEIPYEPIKDDSIPF